jgi:hypothetical protein
VQCDDARSFSSLLAFLATINLLRRSAELRYAPPCASESGPYKMSDDLSEVAFCLEWQWCRNCENDTANALLMYLHAAELGSGVAQKACTRRAMVSST